MPRPNSDTHYMKGEYDTFKIANNMRQVRIARGYSSQEMARILGISHTQLSKIETHKTTNISRATVQRMSERFVIPLSDLVVKINHETDTKDIALWNWITNEKESLPYLQSAFYQYLKDKGQIKLEGQ